jgi:UDP-N-acetylglucosamine/UDP-N-acetylgalactosamine diphosphorylase
MDHSFIPDSIAPNDERLGLDEVRKGSIAVILLAGGMGSRLGFKGPKGTFILPHIGKSLFQIHAEKIHKREKETGSVCHLFIMCSNQNITATEQFFQKNHFFGLHKEQLHFFIQKDMPAVFPSKSSTQRKLFLPCGNGDLFNSFPQDQIDIFSHFSIIPVDNPLAEPLSPAFIGYHIRKSNDCSLMCIPAKKGESVGMVSREEGRLKITEYFHQKKEKTIFGNSGIMLFSSPFMQKMRSHALLMPVHRVKKTVELDGEKKTVYKYETFIFDALPFAKKASAICDTKREMFAPLKEKKSMSEILQRIIYQ